MWNKVFSQSKAASGNGVWLPFKYGERHTRASPHILLKLDQCRQRSRGAGRGQEVDPHTQGPADIFGSWGSVDGAETMSCARRCLFLSFLLGTRAPECWAGLLPRNSSSLLIPLEFIAITSIIATSFGINMGVMWKWIMHAGVFIFLV